MRILLPAHPPRPARLLHVVSLHPCRFITAGFYLQPSPIGTLYIHTVDATLQGALPIILAAVIISPHPLTLYTYIFLRIAENVINHSGLQNWVIDLITLKFLPLRASVAHHDAHHKYSNYDRNAKNYAENWVIWDFLFGTLRP